MLYLLGSCGPGRASVVSAVCFSILRSFIHSSIDHEPLSGAEVWRGPSATWALSLHICICDVWLLRPRGPKPGCPPPGVPAECFMSSQRAILTRHCHLLNCSSFSWWLSPLLPALEVVHVFFTGFLQPEDV